MIKKISKEEAFKQMKELQKKGSSEQEIVQHFIGKVENLRSPDSSLAAGSLIILLRNGNTMGPTSNRADGLTQKKTKNMDAYHLKKDIALIFKETRWSSDTKLKMIQALVE